MIDVRHHHAKMSGELGKDFANCLHRQGVCGSN